MSPEAMSPEPVPRTAGPGMRLHCRISLVLGVTTIAFAAIMWLMQAQQQRQVTTMMEERADETQRVLKKIVDLRASGAGVHVDDYSRWDDFVSYMQSPDAEWADINLDQSIATFNLDAAWVLNTRFERIYATTPEDGPLFDDLPASSAEFSRVLASHPLSHFFASGPRGLVEIWTAPIQPSADFKRLTKPHGYYVVGRIWTRERLAQLADLAGGTVDLLAADGFVPGLESSVATGRIGVRTALPGIDGAPVAGLVFVTSFPVARQVNDALRSAAVLAMVGAALALVAIWWAVMIWVGRPLASIAQALEDEDPAPLDRASRRRDELGQVSRLVQSFFVQREALIAARQAAEAASEAKSNFLANISHELRTPMHGILSFSRFGMRDAGTGSRTDLEDHFHQIHDCGESLLTLLNALLDLSKLEAGRMPFAYSEMLLADVVDIAVDEFRSLYHERMIALDTNIAPDLVPIVADRDRLLQVVRNLISNAVRFTPSGGRVTVHVRGNRETQQIAVEDSGLGIPPGEEELIFQKFTQASHSSPRTGGTGLGLAICREIIGAHDGRIWAENRSEGGARVVLDVPVRGPVSRVEASPPATPAVDRTSTRAPDDVNQRWRNAA